MAECCTSEQRAQFPDGLTSDCAERACKHCVGELDKHSLPSAVSASVLAVSERVPAVSESADVAAQRLVRLAKQRSLARLDRLKDDVTCVVVQLNCSGRPFGAAPPPERPCACALQ